MQAQSDYRAPEPQDAPQPTEIEKPEQPQAETKCAYAKPYLRPRKESEEGDLWCD